MNKETALNYIQNNTIIGIKAGHQRPGFLEIWMVVVQNRIFARSWGLAERSWYNAFLEDSAGKIQCGETIYPIKAIIPEDINKLTDEINQAYLTKYNSGHNIQYSQGIIQEKHVTKTMEFIILK
ncbi:DUF2255 domain-containing protein [Chryseobacterium sp. CH21]|uniref:DUF2255 family protein n=1 Tax=Chryseobacterium sp. CH21 TaxID=713556 RepID=UPI00100BE9D8|nr:DUF2255 family protein [Chryseobacterium sp. CH21]RXM38945.1 DUF2255 domain-containing protein [Chryseobacterium sp. CH21]